MHGPHLWNAVVNSLKTLKSVEHFRKNFKLKFISSYDYPSFFEQCPLTVIFVCLFVFNKSFYVYFFVIRL